MHPDPFRRLLVLGITLATVFVAARGTARAAEWQPIGPDGGTVVQLAVAPSDESYVYAGTRGSVFSSHDGGQTWQPPRSFSMQPSDLAVDGRLPRVAFGQGAPAADGQDLEVQRVHRVRPYREPVSGRMRLDHLVQAGPA